jgi:uncharacterized protein YndB with AHSA1/START domain
MSSSTVHIETQLPYSMEKVWRAWTDPALMTWFGSDPAGTVEQAVLDVRPQGCYEITFKNSDGSEYTCYGIYKEVEEPRRLSFTWNWKNEPGQQSMAAVALEPLGTHGTVMAFTHSDLWAGSAHDYEWGWKRTFEKLGAVLALLES